MGKRDYIPWPEKCAALICLHFGIPYDHAINLTSAQVNSLVDYDHYPKPKAHGGEDKFYNLTPRLKPDHREKTAKVDVPMIAKAKRVSRKHEEFRQRMLAKAGQCEAPPKPKSRIKSRGFDKRWKRTFRNGTVRRPPSET